MLKQIVIGLGLLLLVSSVLAQDDIIFSPAERCFDFSSDLTVQDGLVFQVVDESRPTLGADVLDVWYMQEGQAQYLLRHTDSRAGFITDGERILITLWGGGTRTAYLMNSLQSAPYKLFEPLAEWFAPRWLRDGHIVFNVVTAPDEPVEVVTVQIDHDVDAIPPPQDVGGWMDTIYIFEDAEAIFASDQIQFGATISPDEQFALVSRYVPESGARLLKLVDLAERQTYWQADDADSTAVLWHPDGTSFVYLRDARHIGEDGYNRNELVWVDRTGETLGMTAFNEPDRPERLSFLQWSPDGRYIAFLAYNDRITLWDGIFYVVDLTERVIIKTCHEGSAHHQFLWSADSQQFLYTNHAFNRDQWFVGDVNTYQLVQINDLLPNSYKVPLVWVNMPD